jgi:hypothetical protein
MLLRMPMQYDDSFSMVRAADLQQRKRCSKKRLRLAAI